MNPMLKQAARRALVIALIICALAIVFYINIAVVVGGLKGLLDFGSFVAAGQLAVQGRNPYADESPLIFNVNFSEIGVAGSAPNLNPPISVLIFESLANFHPLLSVQVWRFLTVVFYIYTFYILIRRSKATTPGIFWRSVWAFSLAGFWHTIELGQLYTFLLLLTAGIIINIEKGKTLAAGILLGVLIAIKPNFVFWAIALGVAGYGASFLAAGITALLISIIPLYFYGFEIYRQWFEASNIFTPHLLLFPGNNSFQGLTARFGLAPVGIAMSAALFFAALFVVYKYKPALSTVNLLSLIVSLLISPIAWTGYTILMLPSFLRIDEWKREHWIAAYIFSFPFYLVLWFFQKGFFNFVFFGWFYGWGLLLILTAAFRDIITNKS